MHPDDIDRIKTILGVEEIPKDTLDEYRLRLRMYHSLGASGPLGALGIVDMLRALDHAPERMIPKDSIIVDWRKLPQDGTVLVETLVVTGEGARQKQAWTPGVFTGFVQMGTLGVRLVSGEVVEAYPKSTRLAKRVVGKAKSFGGKRVYVQNGDDILDGLEIGRDGDVVTVVVDGESEARKVDADLVLPVEEKQPAAAAV